jgi:hypothetical protein
MAISWPLLCAICQGFGENWRAVSPCLLMSPLSISVMIPVGAKDAIRDRCMIATSGACPAIVEVVSLV